MAIALFHARMLRRSIGVAAAALAFASPAVHAAETAAPTLALPQVVAHALSVQRYGEVGRARNALDAASGAALIAEGAFDWSLRSRTGYDRIWQPGINNNFLTADVQTFNVLSSTLYAERQFQSGIRVRPGFIVTREPDNFRSDLARLGNRPLLQVDVPLDRNFGEPPDTLRLQAAQSDVEAARSDTELARQSHLHRVMSAVWTQIAAREKVSVNRELAGRLEDVAERTAKLARAGEAASLAADELRSRAALARALAERDSIDVTAARLQLATLIGVAPESFGGVAGDLPRVTSATIQRRRLSEYVDEAMKRRPELRGYTNRVQAAKLRGLVGEREVDSQLTLTVGHDRLLLNYYTPLGDNRRKGAQQQALAGVNAAEDNLEEARQRVRVETELALEKLVASRTAIDRANAALGTTRERLQLVEMLVDNGRQAPASLADAADQFASARRQTIDASLIYALALADFRRATGAIPDGGAEPATIAALFLSEQP
ncbi:MAG TPA: TolC family protein [Burkholderiales bacterium]|nr:TolC family protein [Burkholderiales bacterium]